MARVKQRMSHRGLKDDIFVLKIFEWVHFLKSNAQQIVIGAIVVVIAGAAGFGWSFYKSSQRDEAGRVLAPGNTAALQSRYSDAIPIYERVKNSYRGTDVAMEAAMGLANAYFQTGQHAEAKDAYQEFLDVYGGKDDLLAVAAASGLAACDEQAGKFAEAARQYEKLAQDHAGGFLCPKFLIDAARCYQSAGQTEQARTLYNRVIEQYKKSTSYVREARNALANL